MNGSALQSTLRELTVFARSRNLWLTFIAVVLLFTLMGPFGTMEELRFLPRLGYWLALHAGAWAAAMVCVVLGDVLLRTRIESMFWRMMIGSIVGAAPIGAIIQFVQFAWFGRAPTLESVVAETLYSIPLCVIFCLISFMAMTSERLQTRHPAAETAEIPASAGLTTPVIAEPPPLLSRLKPENRGRLQHLSVEDHYTLVTTSRGRELILLRFSDAIRETAGMAGLQVHRSHWVADDFVSALNRENGKLSLALADGSEIPVSRTYAAEVRARFGVR